MSTELGAEYEPTVDEQRLLIIFIGTYAGQAPGVIRPAFAEAWMQLFGSGADEEHNDWFDYVAVAVANIPSAAQEDTRARMMDHARMTGHSVKLALSPTNDFLAVTCDSCGVISGPWNPSQALD